MASIFQGPLFIIGMPRSGTKLLRDLLNRHSRIALLEIETEFLPELVNIVENTNDLSSYPNFQNFYNRAMSWRYFLNREKKNKLIRCLEWYDFCETYSADGIFEALARHDGGVDGRAQIIWGDKSPSYIRYLPMIDYLYPNAKYIHIIRDPRDYCLSINKAWKKNIYRAAQRWSDDVSKCRKEGANIAGNKYIEVRYEDLVDDPHTVLCCICDFLDLTFENQMLQLAKPSENIGDAKGINTIVEGNYGKWRDRLTLYQIKKIEIICGNLMRKIGYQCMFEVVSKRLSVIELEIYKILDGLNLLKFNIKKEGNLISALQSMSGAKLSNKATQKLPKKNITNSDHRCDETK